MGQYLGIVVNGELSVTSVPSLASDLFLMHGAHPLQQ